MAITTWTGMAENEFASIWSDILREVKEKIHSEPVFVTGTSVVTVNLGPMGIDFSRFSSLQKLVRITWMCLKFLKINVFDKLSSASKIRFGSSILANVDKSLSDQSYQAAIRLLVRSVQGMAFRKEISTIDRGAKSPLISQLNLRLDSTGILRVFGRYHHADLPESARCPVLLPKNHEFSKLVVQDVHVSNKHIGVSHTLSELRRFYWIPLGRSYVQKVLHRCRTCRAFKSAPTFRLPEMPPWPKERVCRSAPFQFVGVDYFGPMKVRVGSELQKMWASLFTCLSTRAVHIEPVLDCTSAEFFNAFLRFVSRRGYPSQIISDNAAQFQLTHILADKAWKETPEDPSIVSYLARNGIKWIFIVELAPWQGGHYERLVGVVKSVLKTVVGGRLLSWSDLVTLMVETESIVNSRPITYVNSASDENFAILRPVDFLLFRPVNSPPLIASDFPVRDLGDAGRLASLWKQRERYVQQFWAVWYDHYLLSLRERASMFHKSRRNRIDRIPSVGEVVIVKDDNAPRGSWKLARIS
ncbi:MAG: hypothetical protein AAF423_14260, partial [Pseudomonadota bacterium]